MRGDARKRLTDPDAYTWPDGTTRLAAQLATAQNKLTRIRALVLTLNEQSTDDDLGLTERLIRLAVAGEIEAALHAEGPAHD